MYKYLFSLCLLALSFGSQAKTTSMFVKFSQFMTDKQETYLEMYFSIQASSLDYATRVNGLYQGGMEVTVQILQDSNVVTGDRFRILSPLYNDTSSISRSLLHQQRFQIPSGEYTIKLKLEDINDTAEVHNFAPQINLTLKPDQAQSSDIMLLESYAKTDEGSQYSRSGYEIIPIVTSGSYFFPESEKKLSFYAELYNIDKKVGKDSAYLVKYYLERDEAGQALNKYASFSKRKARPVEPILASFNIDKLPTGQYNLVIEALNKEGVIMVDRSVFFYRKNATQAVVEGSFENNDYTGTFVDRMGNLDSVYKFVEYLFPISTDRERALQKELLSQGDEKKLKRYFYTFWQEKDRFDPQGRWNKYHDKIRHVNREFTTGMRAGYRSDRGRVYLTYGKPTQVDSRKMEPNLPPYEIWQYNQINTPYATPQTNRIFIFGEFDPSTQEYQLFHSTALGELQSRDWRSDLYYRAYGGPGSIDPSSDPDSREFGSRVNQNIILNSTNSDRRNR